MCLAVVGLLSCACVHIVVAFIAFAGMQDFAELHSMLRLLAGFVGARMGTTLFVCCAAL
jgi:hypothetical protein